MGIFDFVKSAGEKVLGAATAGNTAGALLDHLKSKGLAGPDVKVSFDPATTKTIMGSTLSQADKEKLILALGNVEGMGKVRGRIAGGKAGDGCNFLYGEKGRYPVHHRQGAGVGKSSAYMKILRPTSRC